VNYWAVFARAWNNLPMAERTAVLSEVLCILEEELLQWCIDSIWNIRNQLLRPSVLLEKQFAQNLIAALSEQINNRAEMVEDKALFALQSKFDEMGADGFVGMLRSRTKRQLDWIKVNGSVWGFVLGAIAGGLALLF